MSNLYMIELRPDVPALMRFLNAKGLDSRDGDEDMGYGVHTWLIDVFGELAPKPWRLLMDRRRPPRILGYAGHDAKVLRQRMREFADPGAFAVCDDPNTTIASRGMPIWRPGRRLGFEVQCSPVGRKARTGVEKDLFLMRADDAESGVLSRETVYCDWARQRLQRCGAAEVASIYLEGFRLVRMLRRNHRRSGQRTRLVRPQALLRGELTVSDPDAFSKLLAQGLGRHRAFGYGMLLLRPPS